MTQLTDVPVVTCAVIGHPTSEVSELLHKFALMSGLPYSTESGEVATAFKGQKCVFIDDERLGQENKRADVVMLCVSVAWPNTQPSLAELKSTVDEKIRGVPFVVCGTHIEKRLNDGESTMPLSAAEQLSARLGASKYLECSAATGEGIDDVFEDCFYVGQQNALRVLRRERTKHLIASSERKSSCITQ